MAFLEEGLCEEILSFAEHDTVRKAPWLKDTELQDMYTKSIGGWKNVKHSAVKKIQPTPRR
ncbi:hypothetical protein GF402_02640 [Candidatus Fermentibacteria bacterium]|nr:hypothetical protein [Candidatus Fermentibacteria bacterium]